MKFNVWPYEELVCDLVFSGMTDMEISEKYKHLIPTPEEWTIVNKVDTIYKEKVPSTAA